MHYTTTVYKLIIDSPSQQEFGLFGGSSGALQSAQAEVDGIDKNCFSTHIVVTIHDGGNGTFYTIDLEIKRVRKPSGFTNIVMPSDLLPVTANTICKWVVLKLVLILNI